MPRKLWEIWNASIKFEDSDEVKTRPVLVIGNKIAIVVALKMTSTPPRNCWGEYSIVKWKEAGLSKPTTVRCSKVLELNDSDFRSRIGRLHPLDILAVQEIISQT